MWGASKIVINVFDTLFNALFNSTFRRNSDIEHIGKQSPSTDR